MKIFTKDGMRKLKKSKEFKDFKYLFAPNMSDVKYLVYNFVLILFVISLISVFG